jgi:hypothetical protein
MKVIQILICALGIVVGSFVFLKPELTIKIQTKFYEKINWRMEPISLPKEIKSTKLMGFFLLSVCIAALFIAVL